MSSTSSQHYRSANTLSHYPNFPANNHEHLYSQTGPWQPESSQASYGGPPSDPFDHYSQDGNGPVALPSSTPRCWFAGRPRQDLQIWEQSVGSHAFVSRSTLPYDTSGGGVALLQPSSAASRQYHQHQALEPGQSTALGAAGDTYRTTGTFQELRLSSESPATTVDPPFTTHGQARTAPSHGNIQEQPRQPPVNIAWESRSEISPVEPQRYPGDTKNALAVSQISLAQAHASGPPWPMAAPSDVVVGPPECTQRSDADQQWSLTQTRPDQGQYTHPTQFEHLTGSSVSAQGPRKSSVKKTAAKVPSSFVERQEKLKVSKRKGPLQERQREKTHTMRKTKRICVRCRFYKSGCDEGDPCEKCQKITGHARSFREPCYREHLEDTSLVRRCNGREHQEEAEFLGYDWVYNSQIYEMEIMWNLPGYGQIPNAQPIRVHFRPYSPKRGSLDMAASVWTNKDGEVKAIQQPAYAIYDTANLLPAFERYFSSLQPAIEEWIFSRINQDEIASLTYREIVRMRTVNRSVALDLAMRLQCLSVVSQGYGSVWSNNIPGIREYDYRQLGRSDYEAYDRKAYDRPLPGAITHQMDVAAVKYLRKLEKAFVKELAALIFKPKIKPWYELFLAFYVIFWNLEYIHHGANDYIKSKNGTLIESQVNNVVNSQIKKWELAFPVLLYHWRCTLRGYSPFRLARENPPELRDKGHLDHEGFLYVTKIAEIFDRESPERFQPPLTGFAATHHSVSSEWLVNLFKEAGA